MLGRQRDESGAWRRVSKEQCLGGGCPNHLKEYLEQGLGGWGPLGVIGGRGQGLWAGQIGDLRGGAGLAGTG